MASQKELIESGRELANALGWGEYKIRQRSISRGGTQLDVARTYIAGESALLFASVQSVNGYDPLESAALYGYHVAHEWGVVVDKSAQLTIFNSRWSDYGDWYSLPPIALDEAFSDNEYRRALGPEGLVSGALARIAESIKAPSSVLVPVDDSLVERLDRWRDQALKFAGSTPNVDALLQLVYAQLFVLRTVEDRALDPTVPPVSGVIDKRTGEVSPRKWSSLIKAAREKIGGELFARDNGRQIPPHVLAGVIHDLYKPQRIPGDARYDFSWIDSDVLGMAYEKYLASVLQPGAVSPQVDLFLNSEREVERFSVRKKKGAYYTPKFITNYLAAKTVDKFFEGDSLEAPFVIDFACGSGAFLVAAVDQILDRLKASDPDKDWARQLIESRHVVGIDLDVNAVNLARLRLWQRLLEEPNTLPLPSLAAVIVQADGLRRDSWGDLNRPYDIVLGNPPFLATGKVEDREALESKFSTAKGRFDFSSLFVEQGVQILKPHGQLGMVVPNRFFRNTSGATLRELLVRETNIVSIVDFGTTKPFDANAYVACLVVEKRSPSDVPISTTTVVEVKNLDPQFLAGLLLNEAPRQDDAVRVFQTKHPSSDQPWVLISTRDQIARIRVEEESVPLHQLAEIAQGIRTGANDFFIFEVISDDGSHLCEVSNGLGDRAIVERDLLESVVYGSEVVRFGRVHASKRLLYPYRSGSPISEAELQHKFPHTWNYLAANRELLGSRSSLMEKGGKFYELVRPRDEAWLRRPKLLIRDLAPRTSFAVDEVGDTFLVGGTAIAPSDSDLLGLLLAYLNSSFVNEYVRHRTPSFQGGYQKFEPKHLRDIPVLRRLLLDQELQRQLFQLAWRAIEVQGEPETQASIETEIDRLITAIAKG